MKLSIKVASTSQTVNVFIRDSSSSTGAGLTGLVFNSASLTAYYMLPRAAAVAITLATQTVTGAWSSGGFVEISSTNAPGWYRLDLPDAAVASGRFVDVHLKGAANMAPLPVEIELTGWDNQNATSGGITDIDATISSRMATFTLPTNFSALGISAAGKINEVVLADTLTTYTGNTPQTGDAFARLGVAGVGLTNLGDTRIAHLDADISSRTKPADTQAAVTLVTTATNLTNAPTSGDFTAAMKTSLNAATPAVTVSDKTGFSLTAAYDAAKTAAQPGDAMALTSGERTTLTGVIWAAASRTLTSFGTLVADVATAVWAAGARTLTAFGFTVTTDVSSTVTTNLNATVSSRLASASYTAPDNAGIASIESAVGSLPTATQNADALLKRDWTAISGEATFSAINALRNMRNHVVISGSTVTVFKEDGTTTAYTLTITTDATQDPIVTVTP